MANLRWYENGVNEPPIFFDNISLPEWILSKWSKDTIPQGLRIYKGPISSENDITKCIIETGFENNHNVTYEIAIMPAGTAVASLVVTALISVAAAVLLQPNIDTPESATSTVNSSANELGSRANKPRLGSRIPDIRGLEVNCIPDLWSNYRFFENQVEFDLAYLCISSGSGVASNIRDGLTDYSTIDGASLEIYAPYTSPRSGHSPVDSIGSPITQDIFVVEESNEVTGQSLIPPNINIMPSPYRYASNGGIRSDDSSVDPRLFHNAGDQIVLIEWFVFEETSQGSGVYTRYDISGTYTIASVTETEIVVTIPPAQQAGWDAIETNYMLVTSRAWQNNTTPANWALIDPGAGWTEHNFAIAINPVGVTAFIGPFVVSGTDVCLVNLIAPQGLYKKGQTTEYFSIEVQYVFENLDNPGEITNGIITLSSNREEQSATSVFFTTPYTNATLTLNRTSARDYSFNGSVIDDVKWRDLYLMKIPEENQYGNVTTCLALTKGTQSALKLKELQVNMQWLRNAEIDGGLQVSSNNWADVILSIHLDPYFGRGSIETINKTNLYAVQQEIIDYFGSDLFIKVGYTFDSLKTRYEEALSILCDAVNVTYIPIGNQINFFFERPQDNAGLQFGALNKNFSSGEERISRSFKPFNEHDSVVLTYRDQVTRTTETLYFPEDRSGFRPLEVNYLGCINRRPALVHGWREYYKLINGREQHEFTALDVGRLANRGLRIDVIDNTDFMNNSGYITQQSGLKVTLSEPASFNGVNKSIGLTRSDGSVEVIPITEVSDDEFSVFLTRQPTEAIYTGWDREKTQYTLLSDNERLNSARLVRETEYNGPDDIRVNCINYTPLYYQQDLLV